MIYSVVSSWQVIAQWLDRYLTGSIASMVAPKVIRTCLIISVISAKEMYQSVMDNIVGQDIFIACAAVSDYSIKNIAKNKIKKSEKTLILELTPTKDILQEVCKLTKKPVCIGFAAETQNLTENAKNKLKNKGCDAIILNDVSKHDLGFKSDENEVLILTPENSIKIEKNSKQKLGRKIIKILSEQFL
jgi:phosphopantothenoylcysteine decarboxylase/phosphopantothenate--cysteine ligase